MNFSTFEWISHWKDVGSWRWKIFRFVLYISNAKEIPSIPCHLYFSGSVWGFEGFTRCSIRSYLNNILTRFKELPTARREYYLVRRSSLNIILTQKSFFFVYVRKYIYMDADKSRKNIGIFVMFFGYTMVLLCLPSCLLFAWMWKVKYSFRWQKDFNLLDRTRTWIRVVIWLSYDLISSFIWHKVPSIL